VVERTLGKGEVESPILSSGTKKTLHTCSMVRTLEGADQAYDSLQRHQKNHNERPEQGLKSKSDTQVRATLFFDYVTICATRQTVSSPSKATRFTCFSSALTGFG
jgi:hypothetical protein